jgi:hypothetical protein
MAPRSVGGTEVGLKASAVLNPRAFLNVRIPANEPRVALTIHFPTGFSMTAAVNAKAIRKIVTAVSEAEDPDSIAVVVQGRIDGTNLLEAEINAIAKVQKATAATEAA